MFFKRVIQWYAMLCYSMLWNVMECMVCYGISMLCYDMCMLRHAMVYVVKNKHGVTVIYFTYFISRLLYDITNKSVFRAIKWGGGYQIILILR